MSLAVREKPALTATAPYSERRDGRALYVLAQAGRWLILVPRRTKASSAGVCALLLIGLVAGCTPVPPDHPSPDEAADGWVCSNVHPQGTLKSSCWRSDTECIDILMGRDPALIPCRGKRPNACVRRARVACFAYENLDQPGERPHHTCAARIEECERERRRLVEDAEYYNRYLRTLLLEKCVWVSPDDEPPPPPLHEPTSPFERRLRRHAEVRASSLSPARLRIASACLWWD